jgi:hypothetical protein
VCAGLDPFYASAAPSPTNSKPYRVGQIMLRRTIIHIAIDDENPARTAVIREGLDSSSLSDIAILFQQAGLVGRIDAFASDMILNDIAKRPSQAAPVAMLKPKPPSWSFSRSPAQHR